MMPAMARRGSAEAGRREPGDRLPGLAETLESHRGLAEVVASVRAGHGGSIGGTWGSASALAVAALSRAGLPALVVVLPPAAEADACVADLAPFSPVPAARLPALEAFDAEADGGGPDPAEPARLAVVKQLVPASSTSPPTIQRQAWRAGSSPAGGGRPSDGRQDAEPSREPVAGSSPAGGGPPSDGRQDAEPSRKAAAEPSRVIVTSIQALLAPLADPRDVAAGTRRLVVGGRLDPGELADWLASRGWQPTDA
ncbi:MAG: hypothetical protein ACKON7_06700, partial [Planctomycetaceae bacterium]